MAGEGVLSAGRSIVKDELDEEGADDDGDDEEEDVDAEGVSSSGLMLSDGRVVFVACSDIEVEGYPHTARAGTLFPLS